MSGSPIYPGDIIEPVSDINGLRQNITIKVFKVCVLPSLCQNTLYSSRYFCQIKLRDMRINHTLMPHLNASLSNQTNILSTNYMFVLCVLFYVIELNILECNVFSYMGSIILYLFSIVEPV